MTASPIIFRELERYRPSLMGILILCLALLCVLGLAIHQQRMNAEAASLHAQLAELERKRISAQPVIPDLPTTTPEQMQLVLQKMNFPWEGFFQALETAATTEATLLSVTTDAGYGEVQLRGSAKDLYAALDYMGRLAEQKRFLDAKLIEHEINTQNVVLPLTFVIRARWNTEPDPL